MPDLKPDLYSVEPDGTKTDQWIMEELLGADPVDDDYVHNIDMPVLRTDDDEALDLRDPSPILLEWDEAQHPRDSKGQFSQADLHAVSERIRQASNGSIAVLDLRPKQQAGDVELETIATAPGQGQQGAGTRAMESLTAWADQHGVRLVLSPSQKGYHPVAGGLKTTSSARLKTFYKRFGFVEPKGRNYDPSISSPTRPVMFRPPKGKKHLSSTFDLYSSDQPRDEGGRFSDSGTSVGAPYFDRNPHLAPFRFIPVVRSEGTGSRHPEAEVSGGKIHLYPKFDLLAPKVQDFVFAHEVGHAVLDRAGLSTFVADAKALGVDVWNTATLPFGQSNMHEAFADSFASYHTDKEVVTRHPAWATLVERYAAKYHLSSTYRDKLALLLGGEGSGNFGHAGRPGEVGGSASGAGAERAEYEKRYQTWKTANAAFNEARSAYNAVRERLDQEHGVGAALFKPGAEQMSPAAIRAIEAQIAKHPDLVQAKRAMLVAEGAKNEADTLLDAQAPRMKQEVMSAHVQTVADRLGYDPAHVDVVDIAPREFTVGGRLLHEGGHYDPSTGRIEINVRTNTTEPMVQGLIAHEIMHAQDDTVSKARQVDHDDIRRLIDEDTERVSNDYDRLFGRNGYPKNAAIPEIEARWPVAAAMAKTHPHGDTYLGTWGQNAEGKWAFDDDAHRNRAEQMQKDDGFTAYSKLYWDQVKAPYTVEYWRAISETVAEVGAYQDRAPRGPWKEGVPAKSWQAYGRAIKAQYPRAAKQTAPKEMPPQDEPPPEDER